MYTVRFSISLCTRPAATNTATIRPKKAHRDEAEVGHHAALLAEADAAQPEAAHDHQEGEQHDDAEHAVADGLLERVDRDRPELVHAVTTVMKKSSNVGASASASGTVPRQMTRSDRMMAMCVQRSWTSLKDMRVEEHGLTALVQVAR